MLGCAQKQVNVVDEPIDSRMVGKPYLGITSRLPVIRPES
jgi:hypothetical protein